MFGGGAALLFAKQPCTGVETYNDLDGGLVNLFRVLQDPDKFENLRRRTSLTLYSREEYERCCKLEPKDDIDWAYAFFVMTRMSIVGIMGSGNWSRNVNVSSSDCGASRYTAAIGRLPQIHNRLSRVQIEHRDFRDLFPVFIAPHTLIYCDPPYMHETRTADNKYKYEMTDKDHEDLLDALVKYPQMSILSGYDNDLYNDVLSDWRRVILSTANYKVMASAKRPKPNEILWLNPLAWDTLHKNKQINLF